LFSQSCLLILKLIQHYK